MLQMQSSPDGKLGQAANRLILIAILLSVVVTTVGCSPVVSEWETYSYDNWAVEYPVGWNVTVNPEDYLVYYDVEFSSISGDTFCIWKVKEEQKGDRRNYKYVGPYVLGVWTDEMRNGTWDPVMVWDYGLPDKELQEKFDHFVGSFEVK